MIFTHCGSWGHFQRSGVGRSYRRIECSMLKSNPAVPEQSPSSWIQYARTVRYSYILFVFTVCSFFCACNPGLVYLRPSNPDVPLQSLSRWIQYNQTVRHRCILFVFMVCSLFCRMQSALRIYSA